MDFSELTNIILTRIQKLEPDNAIKILGCLFLSSPSEQRMLQLAFGPDDEIISIISDAKITLSILFAKQAVSVQPVPDRPLQFNSFSPAVSCPSLCAHSPYWEPQLASDQKAHIHNLNFVPNPFVNPIGDECTLRNQARFLSLHERPDTMNPMGSNFSSSGYYHDDALSGGLNLRASGRSSSLPEFPTKVCHYFFKGNCKHGENCKYLHGPCISDGDSHIYNLNLDDLEIEEDEFSPGSLDKLEMEIIELLKGREGVPVSIASLPMLYNEKYGKNLQAEGYLTESQRHGKSGFSLTKLLARLKNSIRLIDRPHGQHSVILAEDVPRYVDFVNKRSESGALASSSHQIYLTFPAESTFTTDDVSNYFKQYGPVRDVRIPCQDKRMFGFVSFLYLETVKAILTKRNPHYICGARVLVKPYKEKSRTSDRTYTENFQPQVYFPPHYVTMDPDFQAVQRQFSSSRLLKKQQIEEHERLLELERRHFSEFNLEMKPQTEPYFSYSMEDYKIPEGLNKYPIVDHFSYTLDNLNNGSTNDVKVKSTGNGHDNEESQIELPESPFASPHIESSNSAII